MSNYELEHKYNDDTVKKLSDLYHEVLLGLEEDPEREGLQKDLRNALQKQ